MARALLSAGKRALKEMMTGAKCQIGKRRIGDAFKLTIL
jgi:hypothetical protein